MRRAVFSILVGNSAGVLSRVAGMFRRIGYNIYSITVGETLNPEYSRMTIAVTGEDDVLEQINRRSCNIIISRIKFQFQQRFIQSVSDQLDIACQ